MTNPILLFDDLPVPKREEQGPLTFCAKQIPEYPAFHIAKDAKARPVIVLHSHDQDQHFSPNIELENLRVAHNIQCKIIKGKDDTIISKFSVVQCLSDDRIIQEYFVGTLYDFLISRHGDTTSAEASFIVDKLAELFLALAKPQSRSARGLWAELFLISTSSDPLAMVSAWHVDNIERYDFSYREQHIEVKSSATRQRRHHFSFEQAHPPAGANVLVASILLEATTNGTKLSELWDIVKNKVSSDLTLLLKVENICLSYLGTGYQKAKTFSFDWNLASSSLAFYSMREIPCVSAEQPKGVSEISFTSDLDLVSPIKIDESALPGSLFEKCLAGR